MIRPMRPDEFNFVISNWLRSYAKSDFAMLSTPKSDTRTPVCSGCGRRHVAVVKDEDGRFRPQTGPEYWAGHRALVTRLVARCNVSVAENEDGLLDGFVCREHDRPVLHYLYVRQSARGRGVARELVADLANVATRYSHKGALVDAARLPAGWHFSLYEAFS